MLSNPNSSLQQQRRQQHQRQNSTPIAIEAPIAPNLPALIQRSHSHKRGLSLDQRSPMRHQQFARQQQDGHTVSITNQGLQHQQHILREAQQQRLARPAQQEYQQIAMAPQCGPMPQQNDNTQHNLYINPGSENQTPITESLPGGGYPGFTQALKQQLPTAASNYLDSFGCDIENVSSGSFQPVSAPGSEAPASRRGSLQPYSINGYGSQRPVTPPNQNATSKLLEHRLLGAS